MTSSLPKEAWLWMDYIGDIDGHWVRWTSQNDKVPHAGVAKYVRADFVPRIKPLEWSEKNYFNQSSNTPPEDENNGWAIHADNRLCGFNISYFPQKKTPSVYWCEVLAGGRVLLNWGIYAGPSLEEAKAAAENEYRNRVMSALMED